MVLDVMEPGKCEYTMKATTPAVCEGSTSAFISADGMLVKDEL